jgi:uncharacterized sulfatase
MSERPNILLITSDQQHWDTLGVTNARIRTPALDRLAAEGVRFERSYCSNPVCTPSRASIITGLYPAWHGGWSIGVKTPEDQPFVGDHFSQALYATTLVGKAHFQPLRSRPGSESIESQPLMREIDWWRKFHGPFYGFEHIEIARMHADESHAGQHYGVWMEERGLKNWRDYFDPWPESKEKRVRRHSWDLPEEFHYTTWTAERTIANLERHAREGRPFFLWSSFHDPHPPYLVSEPWASMYDPADVPYPKITPGEFDAMPPHFAKTQQPNPDFSMYRETYGPHGFHSHLVDEPRMRRNIAVYYGMISFMDRGIGRILDALDRLGIASNTLVVFTTDHGHYLGQHGLVAKGAFHYEDLVKTPMLARWPGQIPAGRVSAALQSQVDYAPTFLAAAGLPVPGLMQGVSQLDVWRGKSASARDHVIVENRHEPTKVHLRTYIDERYKVTVYRDADAGELFDLAGDPGETRSLWSSGAHAELKSRLLHRFLQAELKREPTRMPRVWGA